MQAREEGRKRGRGGGGGKIGEGGKGGGERAQETVDRTKIPFNPPRARICWEVRSSFPPFHDCSDYIQWLKRACVHCKNVGWIM